MKTKNNNLAFKEIAFSERQKERVHIGRVKTDVKFSIRPRFVIFSIVFIALMFTTLIFNMVENSEITSKIASMKKQYNIYRSEFLMLHNLAEERINLKFIENYATTNLGMKKPTKKQIYYFSVSNRNSIELNNKNNNS